jgi:hypothetical protein
VVKGESSREYLDVTVTDFFSICKLEAVSICNFFLLRPCLVHKSFIISNFRYIYRVLNINKKQLMIQFVYNLQDESSKFN